ncbi:hypothetical protein FF1_002531 [Malus domestica]
MTVDSICVGIKGFLKELKIIENGIPSEWYWVPVLNYFWLQSMLLLLMMHLFYLLVFASFFLIMERKRPIRIAPWTLFVLLWYSSKKNTSSVYTLHHCSDLALDFRSSSLSTVGTGNKYVILFFYAFDVTFVCRIEAQAATTMSMENRESDRGIASPVHPIQGN